jgi:hypothetical protein
MTNITDLTTAQLKSIIAIKEQIESLQNQIESIAASDGEVPTQPTVEAPAPARRKYHMTPAHKRKLIKALAKARKIRLANLKGEAAAPKKRRMSGAGRAAISAAAKARWAKVKAEGKKTL